MKRTRLTVGLKRRLFPRRKNTRRPRREPRALPQAAEQLEVRTLLSGNPVLVEDINPNGSAGSMTQFESVGDTVFFRASDGTNGLELWKTDGTTTTQVGDINPNGDSTPVGLVNVNGTLIFRAHDGSDFGLYQTDGNTISLVDGVHESNGWSGFVGASRVNYNGELFFTANDGTDGNELWKFDGTSVSLVQDINPGGGSSDPRYLTVINGELYFTADDGTHGSEVWKFDGTSTTRVTDINTSGDSIPAYFTNVNGTVFFRALDDSSGLELWKYDGNTVSQVADINPGSDSSTPGHLANVNGTLFFRADNGTNGAELWKTDGTTPTMVEDIFPGPNSSGIREMTNVNGTAFFTARDAFGDIQVWKSDGSTVTQVTDFNTPSSSDEPSFLTNVNGTLFFMADDGNTGRELWMTDGTTVTQVGDINPGPGSSTPRPLFNANGTLYFPANDGSNGIELWSFTPNQAPTAVVLQNTTPTLPENTDTTNRVKVGEVVVIDDGQGTNTLSLTGTDAAFFEIDGTDLFLKASTPLDFEAKSTYEVTVQVDDASVGNTPDASTDFTLTLIDVNEAPTAVALQNTTPTLAENTDTSSRIKVAEVDVTDDALGTNTLSLTGTDAAFFEIDGTDLFLKANTPLDFETKPTYEVTVQVDDASVGNTPDATTDFTLTLTDVNEAPIAVLLQNILDVIEENTDTSVPIKVADIIITDDALGTNTLSLSGADAASFEIIGSELFLKAGVTLDFETQTAYDLVVEVTDNALGGGPHATTDFTLNVTDVDERPPLVRYVWTLLSRRVQTVRRYLGWFFGW